MKLAQLSNGEVDPFEQAIVRRRDGAETEGLEEIETEQESSKCSAASGKSGAGVLDQRLLLARRT